MAPPARPRRRTAPATRSPLEADRHLGPLLRAARATAPAPVAVVWPLSPDALAAPLEAAALGLIDPVLIGPAAAITRLARERRLALGRHRIVEAGDPVQAATLAVRMAGAGEVRALMKGSLHTDELMTAVVAREGGLRSARRISHAFAMGVPAHDRLLLVTDAAVNIAPDLEAKADIVRNAIDLAHALGIDCPRVALLAAVETVNPRMGATLDAAALCKMADRGQIAGGVLDGPLAFDNALSGEAARIKGIRSEVAGRPDILVAPTLEAGNILYKQLVHFCGAFAAGLVLGARVPVILTSRADSRQSRVASCAIAQLFARHCAATA